MCKLRPRNKTAATAQYLLHTSTLDRISTAWSTNMLSTCRSPMTKEHNAGFRLACRSPLCCYAPWSSLAVSELQLSVGMQLWLYHRAASLQSWIEFNCLRSAAVGKAARLSIYWQDAACRLVIPLRQVALAQLYKYHHQSGNAASGKLVWKQHNWQIINMSVMPFCQWLAACT